CRVAEQEPGLQTDAANEPRVIAENAFQDIRLDHEVDGHSYIANPPSRDGGSLMGDTTAIPEHVPGREGPHHVLLVHRYPSEDDTTLRFCERGDWPTTGQAIS